MSNSHPLESMRRLDFFYNPNRLNVAITRARKQMILTGNTEILNNDIIFKSLIEHVKSKGGYIEYE